MAHVRDDHDEIGEVDEHVFEQLRVLHLRTHPRSRDTGVDADRDSELLAHLVHGIVARVVGRDLRRERHHAHHREARVLARARGCARTIPPGTRRVTDAAGDEEPARVRVARLEQLVGVAVEAAGEHAGRDAELVHQRQQTVARRAGPALLPR